MAMQEALTVKVENVPHKYQTSEKLQAHFETMFPGQVYSAVMMLRDTSELSRLFNAFNWLEDQLSHADSASQQQVSLPS